MRQPITRAEWVAALKAGHPIPTKPSEIEQWQNAIRDAYALMDSNPVDQWIRDRHQPIKPPEKEVEGERVDELIEIPKHMECENVSDKKI